MATEHAFTISAKDHERLQLHFLYVFTIFTLFVAFLMSDRWTDRPNFTEYLTNVATFISLVLGLVAIFYAFFSNSSLSQSLGNITKASDEVASARIEIENVVQHAIELENSTKENTQSLQTVSNSIEERIANLNAALQEVSDNTALLHTAVQQIPARFDQLENKLTETNSSAPKNKDHGSTDGARTGKYSRAIISDYLKFSSINGRYLIYACILANESGKGFEINEIAEITKTTTQYLYGYLVATHAMDIIDKRDNPNKEQTYEITYLDPILKEHGKSMIVSEFEKRYKTDDKALRAYKQKLEKIDQMFKI
jgi:uncharacterized protein YoxC